MWCGTRGFLERIQHYACRTILWHQFKSYRDAVGKCNLEYLKDRRETHCKKYAQGLGDNVRTCHLLPPSRFSLMVEIWEIHQICPSIAWKPVASEKKPCAILHFAFEQKPNPFPERQFALFSQYCFWYFRSIVSGCPWACWRMLMHTLVPWPVYAALPLCATVPHIVHWWLTQLELNSIHLHTGWVGVWGWALCILSLGRSVCMRVWEYVQGCQVVMYISAITTFICVFSCVLAGN